MCKHFDIFVNIFNNDISDNLNFRLILYYLKETYTSRAGKPQIFLTSLCPFSDLEFSKSRCSRALASACGALVIVIHSACMNQQCYHGDDAEK